MYMYSYSTLYEYNKNYYSVLNNLTIPRSIERGIECSVEYPSFLNAKPEHSAEMQISI